MHLSEPPGPGAWLQWVQQLQAISQSGLAFSKDPFDIERYKQLRELSALIASRHSDAPFARIESLFSQSTGYATPRIEVRGAVFDAKHRLLMVQELSDSHRWTLPGGWADVGLSPSVAIHREIQEESGYDTRITKLAAVWDRSRHPYPHGPFACVVLFFLAELLGGTPSSSIETGSSHWFTSSEPWPDNLSFGRVLPHQLDLMVLHHFNPHLPTFFD